MSDTDSFIEEVTEEVRRDRLYKMFRRYGWIGALAVLLIVGGAAWTEYRKAQTRAVAEGLGDQILSALSSELVGERQARLAVIDAETTGPAAVLAFLTAAEAQQAGDTDAAVQALDSIAVNGELPEIYRQVAAFKSLLLQADTMAPDTRRQQLEALASPGAPLALLAQEQLALQEVAEGRRDAAIDRYQTILETAGVSSDLQQRALQVIVALGGTPDIANLPGFEN